MRYDSVALLESSKLKDEFLFYLASAELRHAPNNMASIIIFEEVDWERIWQYDGDQREMQEMRHSFHNRNRNGARWNGKQV